MPCSPPEPRSGKQRAKRKTLCRADGLISQTAFSLYTKNVYIYIYISIYTKCFRWRTSLCWIQTHCPSCCSPSPCFCQDELSAYFVNSLLRWRRWWWRRKRCPLQCKPQGPKASPDSYATHTHTHTMNMHNEEHTLKNNTCSLDKRLFCLSCEENLFPPPTIKPRSCSLTKTIFHTYSLFSGFL